MKIQIKDMLNPLRLRRKKSNYDNMSDTSYLSLNLPRIEELRSFEHNEVWRYISDTLKYRIYAARDDLEDQNADIETMRVHQGRIEELRFILDLPRFIIDQYDNLKAELDAKEAANDKNK
jgi:hypothetical protein